MALYIWGYPNDIGLPMPAFVLAEGAGKKMLRRLGWGSLVNRHSENAQRPQAPSRA